MLPLNFCMPMFGDLLQFLLLIVIAIMSYLLIILPSIVGSILCEINWMSPLFLFKSQLWLRINSLAKSKIYIPTTVVNLSNLEIFWLLVVLAILPLLHILPSKMVLSNVAIDILLKRQWLFHIMPRFLPLIGHITRPHHFILLIVFLLPYSRIQVPLKPYLHDFLTITSCKHLVFSVTLSWLHIIQISFNQSPNPVFFSITLWPNMHSKA